MVRLRQGPSRVYEDIADGTLRLPSSDNALPSDYRVFFYDGDERLLRAFLGSSDGPGPQLPQDVADLHLASGRPSTVPAADGSTGSGWRVIAYSGPDHMRTVVALPLDTVDGATTKLLWLSLGLGIAVAVGVVVLGNGAVRLGLRPLTRVEHTAQHITEGALELNVPVADPNTEVGRLGLALNTMLDRLRTTLHRTETSEAQLRRFLADAGHELRTPLTATCAHTPADSHVHVRVGAARTRARGDQSLGSGPPLPPGTPVSVVEIADNGPGIRPDEAPHVFDRFYRATPFGDPAEPASRAGLEPGSGLGLAIASAIAAAHGGRLELDNRPGAGCTFRLLLPDTTHVPKDDTYEADHDPAHT
ncbi:ATP-binding protein [Streptomyces sp. Tue6028]|uniref:HAMP domain-containing protein n=1 Tax=Streptomyces sp. Tue6028 TaxID=2036037 RepID=UPI003D7107A4